MVIRVSPRLPGVVMTVSRRDETNDAAEMIAVMMCGNDVTDLSPVVSRTLLMMIDERSCAPAPGIGPPK